MATAGTEAGVNFWRSPEGVVDAGLNPASTTTAGTAAAARSAAASCDASVEQNNADRGRLTIPVGGRISPGQALGSMTWRRL
ncbi:hypothetical protein HerbRD11066_52430 [Herbidospora sp. RD11066]